MRIHDSIRPGLLAAGLGALLLLVPAAAALAGNGDPGGPAGIDHYKVYKVLIPPPTNTAIILRDQFGTTTHLPREFEYLATPVMKDGFPIFDPVLHYDWWRFEDQPFQGTVFATNQFGDDQPIDLGAAQFVLLPSLKYPQPGQEIPRANHYKCYAAVGPSPGRIVTLEDQFGFATGLVDSARIFCNPAEKTDAAGILYPMENPEAHLVCYDLKNTEPGPATVVVAQDQFGFWSIQLAEAKWLCVPTFKTGVVPALPTSWGGVKALYR